MNKSRNKEIIDLRKRGWTLLELGQRFQITKERIRQLLNLTEEGMFANTEGKEKRRELSIKKRIKRCKQCSKDFLPSQNNINKGFCSVQCAMTSKKKKIGGEFNPYKSNTKEGYAWKHKMNKIHNPEKLKRYSKTAKENIKNNPEKLEKFLAYQRMRYHIAKLNPEKYQKLKDTAKRSHEKLKADPIRYEEYKRKQRIRNKKSYNKKHGII